jgi:hypothetical protein
LTLWNGKHRVVDRRSTPGPITAYRPFVAVVGGLVPSALRYFFPGGERTRGRPTLDNDAALMARFTLSYPDCTRAAMFTSDTVQPQTAEAWAVVLHRLRELEMRQAEDGTLWPQIVTLTPGGLEVYTQFCNRIAHELNNPDFPPELEPYWIKSKVHLARLALTIHLLRRAGDTSPGGSGLHDGVDAASMTAATQLVQYFMAMARRVVCVAIDDDATQRARAILRWLVRPREQPPAHVKAWEVLQQMHGAQFRRVEDVRAALELLARHHYLRVVPPARDRKGPGRPPEATYEVNPALTSQAAGDSREHPD